MFYTCPGEQNFFNSEECRLYPRNSHVWLCYFTASYLFIDSIFLHIYVGYETPIDRQTMVHHVIGWLNYYIAFWQQDFTVTVGAAFIFLEISTPFVTLRWLFFHHGYKDTLLQHVNTVMLFITFIFGRVFVQAYIIIAFAIDWLIDTWFHREGVPFVYKLILVEMWGAVLVNVTLNFWWSFLIIKQLYRVFAKGAKDTSFEGNSNVTDADAAAVVEAAGGASATKK